MIKIYNTLTEKKEPFNPLNHPYVNMYTCGVTVYDDCHIGHGRSLYIFETIRKYLAFRGYKVKFVRNITDVDDKIINKARELSSKDRISLEEAFHKVRAHYINNYYEDLKKLGITKADVEPLATDNIPQIISFIEGLVKKNFAYQKSNNVYFRIRRFKDYGKLSKRNIDDLFSGVRIEPSPLKEDVLDFALWKGRKNDEPFWGSPFGDGRPGWHIECSVMASRYLGSTLDIHGGGEDLIFPHHENEIAQSEALFEKPFSLYWMHHGLLTIDGRKMSKSLGNFVTLREAINNYSSEVLKIIYLSASYRSPLDFSKEKVKEAERIKERIEVFIKQLNSHTHLSGNDRRNNFSYKVFSGLYTKFVNAMDDDFNMRGGFSVIFDIIRVVNENLSKNKEFFLEAKALLCLILEIFSLESMMSIDTAKFSSVLSEGEITERITRRTHLRKEGKFKEADTIRNELLAQGIILEDLPNGQTIWYRR